MNPTDDQARSQPSSKRGQTMVEFALTLPILLLLMFGVIEFARIFHAWITLQNAARTAARYAITGNWDEESVARAIGYDTYAVGQPDYRPPGDSLRRQAVLDALVPCVADGADPLFAAHWGKPDCDPGDEDDQGLRTDLARLPSIVERARQGARGISMRDGDHIVGLQNPYTGLDVVMNGPAPNEDERGWFHVWICSDRRVVNSDGDAPRYTYEGDNRDNRRCELNEAPLIGGNQYDAGGPGDAVEIIVHFNHPLITPLGLVDYVPLQARRVMINESFRSTRVVNLPSSLLGATWTPSHTFTPTDTPPPTDTPVPTSTATDTPEPTLPPSEEPTLPPVCTDLTFASTNPVQLVGDALQVNVVNHGTAPFFLSGAEVHWRPRSAFGGMYAYEMRLLGRASLWLGNDAGGSGPERIVSLLNPYVWLSGPPDYSERRIDAGATSWQMRFANGPSTLSNYFRTGDFTGTRLMFSTSWGGDSKDCILSLSDLPLPTSTPDTPTPQPVCRDYRVNWGAFESNGVVRYTITNTGTALGYITGFSINWNTYDRSAIRNKVRLDSVSARGAHAWDYPRTIVIWDAPGSSSTPPVSRNTSHTPDWKTTVVIMPGETVDVWLEFNGTTRRLDQEGFFRSDFNGTTFTLNHDCNRQGPQTPTPTVTNTPKPTNTPTKTPVPTATKPKPPTATYTATIPPTATKKSPTATKVPTKTNTPTKTPIALPTQPGSE